MLDEVRLFDALLYNEKMMVVDGMWELNFKNGDQSGTYDGWGAARLVSANFGELFLGCIEADFCNQGLILQHFSR